MTAATLDARTLDHLRTRTVRTLLASVALGSTGHIAAVTVATVVAAELTGDGRLERRARRRPSCWAPRPDPRCCPGSWPAAAGGSA